jgi:hypothetical protein
MAKPKLRQLTFASPPYQKESAQALARSKISGWCNL